MKNKIVILSGGVGGARFLEGLIQVVPQEEIFVIGNTGDDEKFYGLQVSPDLDIVMYTLAGVIDQKQGWGFQNETYNIMKQLTQLGNENWFQLGDKDMATHIHRTNLLKQGRLLSEVTDELVKKFGLNITLVPMSNDSSKTLIKTSHGLLPFQEYFVKNHWRDEVKDIIYSGADTAKPAPGILDKIESAKIIILTPSNPLVSIGTILAIPGIKNALTKTKAKVIAISPIISGKTIKGPADKMMRSMGIEVSSFGVAKYYKEFLDVMIIDTADKELTSEIKQLGINVIVTNTLMKNLKIKKELARTVLAAV